MATTNKLCLIMTCASIMTLSACSTAKISSGTIPEEGLTVSQIYHHSVSPPKIVRIKPVVTKTNDEFKALPNPEVTLYIFPHVMQIDDEQLVKPGFSTRFFLYKQNQYALASELY